MRHSQGHGSEQSILGVHRLRVPAMIIVLARIGSGRINLMRSENMHLILFLQFGLKRGRHPSSLVELRIYLRQLGAGPGTIQQVVETRNV